MTAAAAGRRRLTAGSSVVTVKEQQCHKNSQCGENSSAYSPAPLRDIQCIIDIHLPPADGNKDGHVQGGTLHVQDRALTLCPSSDTRDSSTHSTDSCTPARGPQHVGTTTTRQASCCKYRTGGHSDWVGTADSPLLPSIQHPGGTGRPQPPSLVHAIPMDPGRARTACILSTSTNVTNVNTDIADVNTKVAATCDSGCATPTTVGKQCCSSSGWFSRRLLGLLPLYLAMLLTLLPTTQVAADCSPLPPISHGNITYYQDSPNSTLQAQVTCDLNYRPTGSDVIMCLTSGSWNGTIASCELVLCESLPTIPNGEVLHSGRQVGSTANYTCIKGFRMMGSAERTCLYNATWTGTQPQCRRIVCKHPGTPVDGVADPPDDTDYPAGTTITYSCHLGYNINGSSSTVCSESGSWTEPVPYCSVMNCGTPPVLPHATPVYGSTLLWENVTYTCDVGYTSVDNTSLVCAVNASWSGHVYSCIELPPQSTTEIITTTSDVTTASTHTISQTSVTSVKSITKSLFPESSSSSPVTTSSITTSSASSEESTEQVSSPSTARAPPEGTTYLTTEATSTQGQEVTSSTPEVTSTPPPSTERSTTSDTVDVVTTTSGRDVSTSDVSTVVVTSSTTSQGLSSSAAATLMVPTTLETSSSGATSIATTTGEMSGEKLAIIIGIVIGSVLPVVLIAGLCFLCRRKRNRGAYEVRYSSSPKDDSTIMIESSKPEVYGNGHVMGNGHDNHVTLWRDPVDESPTAHIPEISNPNNRRPPQNNHDSNGSSKDRVQGTSQNNHGNHGNTKVHASNNHGNHSNCRDPTRRNPKNNHSSRSNPKERIKGDTVWVCMAPVKPDRKQDDPGGTATLGETVAHRGINGNTCVTNNNPNKTSRLTQKTAL